MIAKVGSFRLHLPLANGTAMETYSENGENRMATPLPDESLNLNSPLYQADVGALQWTPPGLRLTTLPTPAPNKTFSGTHIW